MNQIMCTSINYQQICVTIILHVPIYVMNCFSFQQFSSKHLFSFQLMLVSVTVNHSQMMIFRNFYRYIAILVNPSTSSPPTVLWSLCVISMLSPHITYAFTVSGDMLSLTPSAFTLICCYP